jgi:phosphoadenosine phosphosulfate reductase
MSAIELYARKSQDFDAKLSKTTDLLRQAARDYAPLIAGEPARISQASSLGAEDVVISHLINSLQLDIGIFVLETGKLHGETLAMLERLKATSRAPVAVFTPVAEAVSEFDEREGKDAIYKSIKLRKSCCQIRKLEPLSRALEQKAAWITGLRREQSGARSDVPSIDRTEVRHVKFNPLANWSWGDVWHFIAVNHLDYNPLHNRFFPSIGCAPCTRAISLGEDFRAGRWWWEDEAVKECGLHVAQPIRPSKALA